MTRPVGVPSTLQDSFDRWMGIADAEVAAATKLQDALRKKDLTANQAAFTELETREAAQGPTCRQDLGLNGCASGASR